MKLEIGCLAMIRQSTIEFDECIEQVKGRFVKIAGRGVCEDGVTPSWRFEEPIPINYMGWKTDLLGTCDLYLQPIVPPGLSIETDADVPVEEVV